MKIKYIVYFLFIISINIVYAQTWTDTIGDTTSGTAGGQTIESYIRGGPFVPSNTGLLDTMFIRVSITVSNKDLKTAVYDSDDNLIDSSEVKTIPLTNDSIIGFEMLKLNPIEAGNVYYFYAWSTKGTGAATLFYNTNSPGDSMYNVSYSYTAWPSYLTTSLFYPDYVHKIFASYSGVEDTTIQAEIPAIHSPYSPLYMQSIYGGSISYPQPCGATTCWWDYDWQYRRLIYCDTSHSQYTANNYIVIKNINTTGDKFLDNGNDIRVVYQSLTGLKEIGRYLTKVNSDSTDIYFRIQNKGIIDTNINIGVQPTYGYYLYYGNSGASSPVSYNNSECIDAPYVVDFNTIGLWHFDDTLGSYYDQTVYDNDIDSIDVIGRKYNGIFGYSPLFNYDSSNIIYCIDDTSLDLGSTIDDEITLEVWINCTNYFNNNDSNEQIIISKGLDNGVNYSLRLEQAGKISFKYYNNDWHIWRTDSLIDTSVDWNHLAFTYNVGDSSTLKFYLNGGLYDGSWIISNDSVFVENDSNLYIGGK